MGLALHNPSDSDYLCNLTEHRHLPGRRENPKQRHPRRPFHWSRDKLSKIDLCYEQEYCEAQARFSRDGILQKADLFGRDDWDDGPTLESKQHHLAALAFQASRGRRNKYRGLGNLDAGLQHRSCPRPNWMADEKEGRALARSSDPLPSDRARERRPPSLERQEAFRDPSTSMSRKRTFSGMSELLEQEELYRLGVLYDDEHERGAGFTLGTIIHDQPLFNVRQAKRGRGRKGKRADEMHTFAPHLPLHLSFSALGEDEALAAFLISPDPAELVPEMEEPTVFTPAPRATERRAASQPALTTIYEVEMEYSMDFLTQPNTQHSLDFDSAPASSDFPDMISDSDNDNESDEDDDEKEDGEDAWALLDRLDDDDDTREEAGGRNGDGGILSPANADAWVVLGDDS